VTLTPGTRLGPYEVTALIGVGGMGEVYRATDTNLGRQVAIKVLPEAFAHDPDRLARFEREAKTLASLNHPNIAQIHGLEKSAGMTALVMELVEGPTLADRIAHGSIPIDEALPIAKQIAEALEAAHEQGIIHRDLKPANIKVRPDGTVKVLDFGLAKAMDLPGAMSSGVSQAPTITTPAMMTGVGMILGTAAYMSPEQARGKPVDKRTDIWAFGCVLFEMLTGTRAFAGDDVQETFVAIMRDGPEWTRLPAALSPAIGTYLRRCVQKDPRQRVQAIGDVRLALEGAFEAAVPWPAESPTAPPLRVWQRPWVASLVVTLVAVVSGLVVWGVVRPAPPAPRLARFEVPMAVSETLALAGSDHDLAISPDGSHVVYRVASAGRSILAVRGIDELTARPLQGTDNSVYAPFISPDGAWVGFSDESDGTLKRVSILGGRPVRISVTGAGGAGIAGASWGEDGTIVFGTGSSGGLQRVAATGGQPEELTKLTPGQTQHAWPDILPGGRAVLFTILSGGIENAQVAVLDLETGQQKVLLPGGIYPRYSSTGHIVYATGGTLRAVPFDVKRLEVTGTAVAILDRVITKDSGAADFALALDGSLVYLSGEVGIIERRLVWVDRMGREEPLAAPARTYLYPRISPDGTRVALEVRDQAADIWTWDFMRQTMTRLTFDPAVDQYPVWSADGRRLIFASGRVGATNLFWQAADGTGAVARLTESPNTQYPTAITPDGTRVVFTETASPTGPDVMLMSLEPPPPSTGLGRGETTEPQRARPLVQTMFNERNAEIDPKGRWLAYESSESGRLEIYVRPFPDVSGGRWHISTAGGRTPLWSRNGQELFYVSLEGFVIGVRVEEGPSWWSSTPKRILEGQYYFAGQGNGRTFDVAPDGKRFLMIRGGSDAAAAPQTRLVFVQHWAEELKRLVPTN
jgi:serine/threonine-protein kinase